MLVEELAEPGDVVMVLDGVGDPMLHPEFDVFARIAVDAGAEIARIYESDFAVQAKDDASPLTEALNSLS